MRPIHELLARIRHDPEFGRGEFVIGYFDRREGLIRVSMRMITFPAGERRAFEVLDDTGQYRRIPFHRVREVYRDGQRIGARPMRLIGQSKKAEKVLYDAFPRIRSVAHEPR
jgi:uncharacterized protein (UPF0248 family)